MSDLFSFTADAYGIAIQSAPLSIYASWSTMTALAVIALAPRIVRIVKTARANRVLRRQVTAPTAPASSGDGYAW